MVARMQVATNRHRSPAVDGIRPTAWDAAGVAVSLAGMALIAFQPRGA